jgi:hypothetical protein
MRNSLHLDENVIRIVAFETVLVVLIAILFKSDLLLYLLAFDFFLRGVVKSNSLLSIIAKFFLFVIPATNKPVFAPPKRFAARIGLVFSILAAVGYSLDYDSVALTVSSILVLCALLESVWSICLGCYIYNWIIVPFTKA